MDDGQERLGKALAGRYTKADPSAVPRVTEAREALVRLTGEPRR